MQDKIPEQIPNPGCEYFKKLQGLQVSQMIPFLFSKSMSQILHKAFLITGVKQTETFS